MSTIVNNVACAACGLVCENITVRIDKDKIVSAEDACPQCAARLIGQSVGALSSATIDGKSSTVDAAIERAAEMLSASRAPLIYGLVGSDVSTQRAAVALTDRLGATIDPALPVFHRAAIEAFQSVGISTCTLGEVKHRADLVMFWGCDPDMTHSTLRERFLSVTGEFVSRRKIVAISSQKPKGHVDEFFQLPADQQYTFISSLRALISGRDVSSAFQIELQTLAELFKTANYSAIIFSSDLNGLVELEALFQLVRQLNASSRCIAIGLGGTQIENVLAWQTGYPCSVNFALGYPRYSFHTFSANYLLEHQQIDVVVMVGSGGLEHLSASAKKQLETLPIILLDDASQQNQLKPAVAISTALPGIHCSGTVFRMDGVPLRLPAIFDSELRTAADLLSAIQQGVFTSCV
jgi:formylmethanofuran dehydrogenase subunit B